jgi:hypothetical protein
MLPARRASRAARAGSPSFLGRQPGRLGSAETRGFPAPPRGGCGCGYSRGRAWFAPEMAYAGLEQVARQWVARLWLRFFARFTGLPGKWGESVSHWFEKRYRAMTENGQGRAAGRAEAGAAGRGAGPFAGANA